MRNFLGVPHFSNESRTRHIFNDFKKKYSKTYSSHSVEQRAFKIFLKNRDFIRKSNAAGKTYTLKMNRFGDLTRQEFKKYLGYSKKGGTWKPLKLNPLNKSIPDSVDWRKKGGVTKVKDQGQCGSCWAFSTTGALEGALFVATGKLVSLSEQEFVDCSHDGNEGCQGGLMDTAFEFAENNQICTEESYPYKADDRKCHMKKDCTVGIKKHSVVGFTDVDPGSEKALMQAIAQQPISIAVEADPFQFYSKGIFSAPCGDQLDHGVLAVGYGESGGIPYWIVKNSWGEDWGESGYIRLGRKPEDEDPEGECGILAQASYPVLAKGLIDE